MVQQPPGPVHDAIVASYNEALMPLFLYMVPLAVAAAVLLLFVMEKPLATAWSRMSCRRQFRRGT